MSEYTILFRMMGDVTEVCDDEGTPLDEVTIRTPRWHFRVESWSNSYHAVDLYDDDQTTAEMEMEFPDDAAAVAWAERFNGLRLDPWRADFVLTPSGEDICMM